MYYFRNLASDVKQFKVVLSNRPGVFASLAFAVDAPSGGISKAYRTIFNVSSSKEDLESAQVWKYCKQDRWEF